MGGLAPRRGVLVAKGTHHYGEEAKASVGLCRHQGATGKEKDIRHLEEGTALHEEG